MEKDELKENKTIKQLDDGEDDDFEDPLDRPGIIEKAKVHGSAQRVYKISNLDKKSKLYKIYTFFFLKN
jgi:hypothetical protein